MMYKSDLCKVRDVTLRVKTMVITFRAYLIKITAKKVGDGLTAITN